MNREAGGVEVKRKAGRLVECSEGVQEGEGGGERGEATPTGPVRGEDGLTWGGRRWRRGRERDEGLRGEARGVELMTQEGGVGEGWREGGMDG